MATEPSTEALPPGYEWVPVREASFREGFSEKTIYNRINSGYYKSRQDADRTYVGIQKVSETVAKQSSEPVQPNYGNGAEIVQELLKQIETIRNVSDERVSEAKAIYESRLQDKDTLVDALQKRITDMEKHGEILNNQLQASHGAIQHRKSIESQLAELKGALMLNKRPWWRLWG